MNTFGTLFRLTSFGESHGVAVGGVIDGCPRPANRFGFYSVGIRPAASDSHASPPHVRRLTGWNFSGIFEGRVLVPP